MDLSREDISLSSLVAFTLARQPVWSKWTENDITYWLSNAIKNSLAFWTIDNNNIKSIVFGREVDKTTIEVLQYCGQIEDKNEFLSIFSCVHPYIKTIVYTRKDRKRKISLVNFLKHI